MMRAHRLRVSVVVAAVVGLGGVAAPVRAAAPIKVGASLSPSAQAAASGVPVELVDRRDEYSQTFANPDGSFRLDQHVAPVRVRDGHGGWHEPDPTLVKDDDGKIHPQWAMSGLVLGGRGPGADLLRMSAHGHPMRIGWSGELPEPVLDGATATYPDVIDGVDLRITATVLGYRQVLVVKSAQAAASSRLRRVAFTVDSGDVRLLPDGQGGIRVLDGGGRQLMTGPAGVMWDSAGDAGEVAMAARRQASLQGSAAAAGGVRPTADEDEPQDAGPGPGDGHAVLPVAVGQSSMAVVPDQRVLNGPDTVFPVFIDPSVELDEVKTLALSSNGEHHYGDWGARGMVGHCSSWGGEYCGDGFNSRVFFEFGPKQLKGKHVLDATLRIKETWSFSCSPKVVQLARAKSQIWSTTVWPGPAAVDQMVDRSVSAGRGSRCSPSQPAADIAFNDNPVEADENLTATVRAFAAGSFPRLTLLLKAQDETDTEAWKRFDHNPALSVNYVVYPGYPQNVGVQQTSTTTACRTTEATAMTVGSRRPPMYGRVENSTGGTLGEFTAVYDLERKGSTGAYEQYGSSEQPTSGAHVPARMMTSYTTGWDMRDASIYRVRVQTRSYYENSSQYLASGFSHWCYFTVDSTAPKPPVVVSVSEYQLCSANDCAAQGGVDQPGTMVVKPAAGDTNVVGYRWSLGDGAMTAVSGTSFTFTPSVAGTQSIRVEAKDVAGRYGSAVSYQIKVAGRVPEVGKWEVADSMGTTTAANTAEGVSGGGLALQGQAVMDARGRRAASVPIGSSDHALAFNGTTAYATTTGPTLKTQSSFTVSAWAYLTSSAHNGTVLAQANGDAKTGYHLYYSSGMNRWVFNWHWRDSTGSFQAVRAASAAPPVVGAWTHLTGVYNEGAKSLTLFVNGKQQSSTLFASNPLPAVTSGPMTVGRTSIAPGSYLDYMSGMVDEVRVWQSALTPGDVALVAATQDGDGANALALVGSWTGAGGMSPAPDLSGYHGPMTARGGAEVDGDLDSFVLDGKDDAFTTTGPVVDETGSFTVSADVTMDAAAIAARSGPFRARIAGQAAASGSSWALYYERDSSGVGRWSFARQTSATSGVVVAASGPVGDVGSPVQLTGVYDTRDGVQLFVDVDLQAPVGDAHVAAPVQGGGLLALGGDVVSGTVSDALPGRVRSLRVFSGAMTATQVVRDVSPEAPVG